MTQAEARVMAKVTAKVMAKVMAKVRAGQYGRLRHKQRDGQPA